MPSFEYTAIDRQGNSVEGQVQAATRDEAALSLTRTGLLVSRLSQVGSGAPTPTARPAPAILQTPSKPVAKPAARVTPRPAAATFAASGRASDLEPIRTKRGRDRDLYLIFSQLQSYAHTGLNPVESFTSVSKTCRRSDYAESLLAAAKTAETGGRMSDVLERYVDLYPPHVIGLVRAGEEGGFMPEAYNMIVDQAHVSHKFKRWFTWLAWVCALSLGCLPFAVLFLRAGRRSWDKQMASGGAESGLGTYTTSVGDEIRWPVGPAILGLVVLIWLFAKIWQALPRRDLRHRLVLLTPSIGKRARSEAMALFGWSMGMLSRVGLAPRTVFQLACQTVPNLHLRHELEAVGDSMSERTKLSEALATTRIVPEEFVPVVQTGEVTGDVPGQLLRAASMQQEEFKMGDTAAKGRVGCWMALAFVVAGLLLFLLVYTVLEIPIIQDVQHWAD